MPSKAEGNVVWDWSFRNHTEAVDLYRELCDKNPDLYSPHYYLSDNLIADRRAAEA